jgi:hypothetical protein
MSKNSEKKFSLELVSETDKTQRYDVVFSNDPYRKVGEIRWGNYYQYAFYPYKNWQFTSIDLFTISFLVRDLNEVRQFEREREKKRKKGIVDE